MLRDLLMVQTIVVSTIVLAWMKFVRRFKWLVHVFLDPTGNLNLSALDIIVSSLCCLTSYVYCALRLEYCSKINYGSLHSAHRLWFKFPTYTTPAAYPLGLRIIRYAEAATYQLRCIVYSRSIKQLK